MNAFDITVLVAIALAALLGLVITAARRGAGSPAPSTESNAYLLIPITLFFILFFIAILRSPSLVSPSGIGSAVLVVAPLVLATYALTPIAMAGRGGVDLSVGPLIGFINVTLIVWLSQNGITSPVVFFLYAMAAGVAYQLLMGLIIVYVRVAPIIVALSGFLALSGLNRVILQRPGGVAPEWIMPWGRGDMIFSPVLAILVIATLGWWALSRTAFFGHLRMMGADERAAYTSGVRIELVRLGAHCVAGIYSGLAAICFTALVSSGDPTQGTTYTLMAVTALVLGGTSLAGGRGGAVGSLFGALNIYLITRVLGTFNFGMVQSFVTDLAYGLILVGALMLTLVLPQIQSRVRVSPLLYFVVLSMVAIGVTLHAQYDRGPRTSIDAAVTAEVEPAPVTADAARDTFAFEAEARDALEQGSMQTALIVRVAYGALLVLALLFVLRLAVIQTRVSGITALFFFVVISLVTLGVHLYSRDAQAVGGGQPGASVERQIEMER